MAKEIRKLLEKPLYPYLFGVFFILYKSSSYFLSFDVKIFLALLVFHFISCYLLTFILSKICKIEKSGFAVLLLFIGLYFSDKIIYNLENWLYFLWIPNKYYLVGLLVFFCLIIFAENRRKIKGFIKGLSPVFNVFLIFSCLLTVFSGIVAAKKMRKPDSYAYQYELQKRPDIVWILMDEYTSSSIWKQYFSFQNPLDTFLENRQFVVLDQIRSRSKFTVSSINNILNYDDSSSQGNYLETYHNLVNNHWSADLSQNHYMIINLDYFDLGRVKKIEHLYIYPTSYFEQVIVETIFYKILYTLFNNVDSYNQKVFLLLRNALNSQKVDPSFIWAHLMVPHGPFFRDKNGQVLKNYAVNLKDTQQLKPRILSYLEYGNSQLMTILNACPDLNKKIVIISGDHGLRYQFVKDSDDYKPYFAIHMPFSYDTAAVKNMKFISRIPGFIMKQLARK